MIWIYCTYTLAHTYRNPYLLPNLVGAGLSIVALPLALLFLKKDSKSSGIGNAT